MWAETKNNGKTWRGVYYGPDGVRRYKTKAHGSKRAAMAAAKEQEVKVKNGEWFDPSAGKETFSTYFETQ